MTEPEHTDRLSAMIARLVTQRACLDFARAELERLPGPLLEVGLGKGRTYDRLRYLFPDRPIYAFDRVVHCPAALRPDEEYLWLGEFRETLKIAAEHLGRVAALAHADIGGEDRRKDRMLAEDVAPLLARLVIRGGLVLTDREMARPEFDALPLPIDGVDFPYYVYRVSA